MDCAGPFSVKEIVLLTDMPGVKAKGLNIGLHDDMLTLDRDVNAPDGTNDQIKETWSKGLNKKSILRRNLPLNKLFAEVSSKALDDITEITQVMISPADTTSHKRGHVAEMESIAQ